MKASEVSPKIWLPMLLVGTLNALGFFQIAVPEQLYQPETVAAITGVLTALLGWFVKDPARTK